MKAIHRLCHTVSISRLILGYLTSPVLHQRPSRIGSYGRSCKNRNAAPKLKLFESGPEPSAEQRESSRAIR